MSSVNFDVRNIDNKKRELLAWKVKNAKDFKLPRMKNWNYDPCRKCRKGWLEEVYNAKTDEFIERIQKDKPNPKCNDCGVEFMQHQRIAVAWLYLKKKGLLADIPGLGKGNPLSEPILTPTGWRPMGELKVGDYVIGSNGGSTKILGVYPQPDDTIMRVTFNDGSWSRVTPDHLWEVWTNPSDANSPGRRYVVTTKEMYENATREITWESAGVSLTREVNLGYKTTGGNKRNKWQIPLVAPVQFDPTHIPEEQDPYTLGVWLGDGSGQSITLNKFDTQDILESISSEAIKSVKFDEGKDSHLVRIVKHCVPEELWGAVPNNKFVPQNFLLSTPENRLAILQGLLDTDGSAIGVGGVEYSTVSYQLAQDVKFLAQSLGGTVREGKSRIPTYIYKGEKRKGQLSYRMNIKLPTEMNPFRVKRKLDKWVRPTKYPVNRLISKIEYDTPEANACIRVEAEDSLYVTRDFIVTHNTFSAIGVLSLMYETGEMPGEKSDKKAIFIPRSPALGQWRQQMIRAMPGLESRILMVDGSMTKEKRKRLYLGDWDVLLVGPEMFRQDFDIITKVGKVELLVSDDIDSLRNRDSQTSYHLDRVGRKAERYIIMTASPLQKRLPELHCVLDAIGGEAALGTYDTFVARHVRTARTNETDQYGKQQSKTVIAGYRGVDTIKKRIAHLVLKRNAEDVTDQRYPSISVSDVFLDLYPAQRAKYKELQREVLTLMKEDGSESQKRIIAIAKLHYGSAICAGMAALGYDDGPRTSVKYDWVIENLSPGGALDEEKVVVFARLKSSIRALQKRLDNVGIKYVTIWGDEPSRQARSDAQQAFWDDPEVRVLIGTSAIEQSLNLQVARHLINVDMILNPERMTQLAGRIRRFGSQYSRVFVHNLLIKDTQEERYLPLLKREAAISSYVWDEKSPIFEELSPIEMARLITG